MTNVTSTDATLEAELNPASPKQSVLYQFQVVANPAEYQPELACPAELEFSSLCLKLETGVGALPLGWLGPADQKNSVSLGLADAGKALDPDTTYHYRVIAAESIWAFDWIDWAEPVVFGADEMFTTMSEPPMIEDKGSAPDEEVDAREGTEAERLIDDGGDHAVIAPAQTSQTTGHPSNARSRAGHCRRRVFGGRTGANLHSHHRVCIWISRSKSL